MIECSVIRNEEGSERLYKKMKTVVCCVCCVAYAGMVCDLDKTPGRTFVLRSPVITDSFNWTCMRVEYHLSSDDVQLTLDLLADDMAIKSYSLLANEAEQWVENPRVESSISAQFIASRYLVSTDDFEYALVSSVVFLPCPPADCKLIMFVHKVHILRKNNNLKLLVKRGIYSNRLLVK